MMMNLMRKKQFLYIFITFILAVVSIWRVSFFVRTFMVSINDDDWCTYNDVDNNNNNNNCYKFMKNKGGNSLFSNVHIHDTLTILQYGAYQEANIDFRNVRHLVTSNLNEETEAAAAALSTIENQQQQQVEPTYVPIQGYRTCLKYSLPEYKNFLQFKLKNNLTIAYIGDSDFACEQCTILNDKAENPVVSHFVEQSKSHRINEMKDITNILNITNQIWKDLSEQICQYKFIHCGPNSTVLCGLLAISVRTPVIVDPVEYQTWPMYMRKFQFVNIGNYTKINESKKLQNDNIQTLVNEMYSTSGIEQLKMILLNNHRIFINQHTIRTTNPLVLHQNGFQEKKYTADNGFNVFLYSHVAQCGPNVSRTHPILEGNVGDVFGSYLADYFSMKQQIQNNNNNVSYYILCTSDFEKPPSNKKFDPVTRKYVTLPDFPKPIITPPINHHLTFSFVGSLVGPATQLIKFNESMDSNNKNILLGVGIINSEGTKLPSSIPSNTMILGVRGPLTRDILLLRFGINAEIVGDPGLYLYPVTQHLKEKHIVVDSLNVINSEESRKELEEHPFFAPPNTHRTTLKRNLCFVSHEVEIKWFEQHMSMYQNISIRAGGWGSGGHFYDIIHFLMNCERVVSSSLHGIVFAHSLFIPAMPIHVTDALQGQDFKFCDYYYGINITSFQGRLPIHPQTMPKDISKWIELVNDFPQPTFPFPIDKLRVYDIFNSLYE